MQSASRRSVKRWLRIQPDNGAYLSKRQGAGRRQAHGSEVCGLRTFRLRASGARITMNIRCAPKAAANAYGSEMTRWCNGPDEVKSPQ